MTTPTRAARPPIPPYLRVLRYVTAGLAVLSAVVYLLIGLQVVPAIEVGPSDPSPLWFGVGAALAFLFGAAVMLVSERLVLWVMGALFQVFAIAAYLGVAEERTPSFEFWGIALRVVQALILVALVVLISRYPQPPRSAAQAASSSGPRTSGTKPKRE